jgi:hypothetical protein
MSPGSVPTGAIHTTSSISALQRGQAMGAGFFGSSDIVGFQTAYKSATRFIVRWLRCYGKSFTAEKFLVKIAAAGPKWRSEVF